MRVEDSAQFRDWFWASLDKTSECWLWPGAKTTAGYGELWDGKRPIYAHRLAYVLSNGPISRGMFVCHHCDNPPCCRPEHLFVGSHSDNMRDMLAKGRGITAEQHARGDNNGRRLHPERYPAMPLNPMPGTKHPSAKLTENDVQEIRRIVADGLETRAILAERYGVSRAKISQITLRQCWKHVP